MVAKRSVAPVIKVLAAATVSTVAIKSSTQKSFSTHFVVLAEMLA